MKHNDENKKNLGQVGSSPEEEAANTPQETSEDTGLQASSVDAATLDAFSDDPEEGLSSEENAPADGQKRRGKREKQKKQRSHAFKHGWLAILITCLFIAAAIIVNVIVGVLADKFPQMNLDMTGTNMNALSENTIDFVKTIDQDVEITVLASEEDYKNNNQYFLQANTLLKQYPVYNDKIKIKYVDLSANPAFASSYPDDDLAAGDYIVKCGERYRVLTTTDLFNMTTDQQTYQQTVESLNLEPAVTTALLNVTSKEQTKVTFINGFGDYNADAYKKLLESNNYELTETTLLTEDIDSDTPVAVLFAPSVDLDSAAVQKLNDFLSNGGDYGKTLIFVANSSYMEDTPILDSFLKEWGMELSKGYIAEMDSSHMPSANNPFASVFDFANDNFTAGLKNASIPMASVYTRPVNILDEKTATPLFKSSEQAALYPFDADESYDITKEAKSAQNAAAISKHTGNDAESAVVVFGSNAMFDSTLLSATSYNNSGYLVNLTNIQTARGDESISIEPKNLQAQELGILSSQIIGISMLLFAIPLAILIIGIVVWARRRHR